MTYREAYKQEEPRYGRAEEIHKEHCPDCLNNFAYNVKPKECEEFCKPQKDQDMAACSACWDSQMDPMEGTSTMRALVYAEKFQKEFSGITYLEWQKLKMGVDEAFDKKKREAEKSLCLRAHDGVEKIIRSLFG